MVAGSWLLGFTLNRDPATCLCVFSPFSFGPLRRCALTPLRHFLFSYKSIFPAPFCLMKSLWQEAFP
jgi:hypothetical protein